MRRRPEILLISKTPPLHDRSGTEHRLFEILRGLALHASVDFLATWHAARHRFKERTVSYLVRDGNFSVANIELLDSGYLAQLGEIGVRTLNRAEPVPFTLRPTNDYDIRPFLQSKAYDLVWLEYFYLADQYLDDIRQHQPWAEVIVDSVDLHFLRQERQCRYLETRVRYSVNAEQEREPLGESHERELRDHRNYAAHVKEHELRSYARCDRVIATGADDLRELRRQLPHAELFEVPAIYEPPAGPPPGPAGRAGVLFVGNFDHGPNSSAAIFLKHEVAPLLEAKGASLPFTIVGNNPSYLIRNMAELGPCAELFRVAGQVGDSSAYYDAARVAAAPLFFGSGMCGKIGEALARGLPVVTTSLGASGWQLTHTENCLVADCAEEFAAAIERLHSEEQLWERLSAAGRSHMAARFGRRQLEAALAPLLDGAALPERPPAPPRRVPPEAELPPAHFPEFASPAVSVIVLCHGQWPYTELCLRSLAHAQKNSAELAVEYILVDNASPDGTASEAANIPGLRVIANRENLGFAAGNNCGVRAARGRDVVILNNDTVVAPYWLHRLRRQSLAVPRAGIIGPCANTEPWQALYEARYNGLDEFFAYNEEIGRCRQGQWELREKISGLCMYIPREVIEKVGLLSEDYGLGYFEDDDYCFRVRDAGFRTLWAKDCYVHHFGSISFGEAGANREQHLNYGMSQFIFKWGKRALRHISLSHQHTLIKPSEMRY